MKRFAPILALAALTVVSGCGDSSQSTTYRSTGSSPLKTASGVFIDSPVEGMEYVSGMQSGFTERDGSFTFQIGQTIRFSIAGIVIGEVFPKGVLTPVDLVPDAFASDTTVRHITRFLMTLDSDGDPTNGITIPPAARTKTHPQIDFAHLDDALIASTVALLTDADPGSIRPVSEAEAYAHLTDSIMHHYSGSYGGAFQGGSAGTWNVTADAAGAITGTVTFPRETITVTGTLDTKGIMTLKDSSSESTWLTCKIWSNGEVTGTWGRTAPTWSGTLTGSKSGSQT